MNVVLFYLFIKPLSYVPLPIMHGLADVLSWLLFRVIGFRKKVILGNLQRSFPEKTEQETDRIAREYYRHLCDLVVEAVRSFSIPEAEIKRRGVIKNPEVLEPFFEKQQAVILCAGHYNNWEMTATAMPMYIKHRVVGLYKPLKDSILNQKITESRSRFGMDMVSIRKTRDFFKADHGVSIILFATDQAPSNPNRAYWTEFLHQDTAVLYGTEAYARKYNYPVIFGYIDKIKRGYYEIRFKVVTDDPASLPEGAITEAHTRLLEEEIRQKPEYWLWSHRRWKHTRPEGWKLETGKPTN
jgi:KDO2-lipid IV(A) lauroyltransferase